MSEKRGSDENILNNEKPSDENEGPLELSENPKEHDDDAEAMIEANDWDRVFLADAENNESEPSVLTPEERFNILGDIEDSEHDDDTNGENDHEDSYGLIVDLLLEPSERESRIERGEGAFTKREKWHLAKNLLKSMGSSVASRVGVRTAYSLPAYVYHRSKVYGNFFGIGGKFEGKGIKGHATDALAESIQHKNLRDLKPDDDITDAEKLSALSINDRKAYLSQILALKSESATNQVIIKEFENEIETEDNHSERRYQLVNEHHKLILAEMDRREKIDELDFKLASLKSSDVQNALSDFNERLSLTKEGSEKHSAQRKELARLLREYRNGDLDDLVKFQDDMDNVLDNYTNLKESGIKVVRDALNTAIMAPATVATGGAALSLGWGSVLHTASNLVAGSAGNSAPYTLRGLGYASTSLAERYSRMSQETDRSEIERTNIERISQNLKSTFVDGVKETYEALIAKDPSGNKNLLQKGIGQAQAVGTLMRTYAIAHGMDFTSEGKIADDLDKIVDGWGKIIDGNLITNDAREFAQNTDAFEPAKKLFASVSRIPNKLQSFEGGIDGVMLSSLKEPDDKMVSLFGNKESREIHYGKIEQKRSVGSTPVVEVTKSSAGETLHEPTTEIKTITKQKTESVGSRQSVEKHTDSIDNSSVNGHDSVWLSLKQIVKNKLFNDPQHGYQSSRYQKTNETVNQWIERTTANLIEAHPEGKSGLSIVKEGDTVSIEKTGDNLKLAVDRKSSIDVTTASKNDIKPVHTAITGEDRSLTELLPKRTNTHDTQSDELNAIISSEKKDKTEQGLILKLQEWIDGAKNNQDKEKLLLRLEQEYDMTGDITTGRAIDEVLKRNTNSNLSSVLGNKKILASESANTQDLTQKSNQENHENVLKNTPLRSVQEKMVLDKHYKNMSLSEPQLALVNIHQKSVSDILQFNPETKGTKIEGIKFEGPIRTMRRGDGTYSSPSLGIKTDQYGNVLNDANPRYSFKNESDKVMYETQNYLRNIITHGYLPNDYQKMNVDDFLLKVDVNSGVYEGYLKHVQLEEDVFIDRGVEQLESKANAEAIYGHLGFTKFHAQHVASEGITVKQLLADDAKYNGIDEKKHNEFYQKLGPNKHYILSSDGRMYDGFNEYRDDFARQSASGVRLARFPQSKEEFVNRHKLAVFIRDVKPNLTDSDSSMKVADFLGKIDHQGSGTGIRFKALEDTQNNTSSKLEATARNKDIPINRHGATPERSIGGLKYIGWRNWSGFDTNIFKIPNISSKLAISYDKVGAVSALDIEHLDRTIDFNDIIKPGIKQNEETKKVARILLSYESALKEIPMDVSKEGNAIVKKMHELIDKTEKKHGDVFYRESTMEKAGKK